MNKKILFGLGLLFMLLISFSICSAITLNDEVISVVDFEINLTYDVARSLNGVMEGNPTRATSGCALGTGCYEGDGTGDAIKIDYLSSALNGSINGSVCLWAYPDVAGTDVLFGRMTDSNGGTASPTLMRTSTGYIHMWSPDTNRTISPLTYTESEWIHICSAWQEGIMMLYINGTNVINGTTDNPIGSNSLPVRIGASDVGGNPASSWDGKIDEVVVWNRSITSAEVLELWNNGNGKTYPFSQNFSVCSNVITFNISINNSFYNTTNGTIYTEHNFTDTTLYNITLNNSLETKTFTNYNISLNGSLTHNYNALTLTAYNKYNSSTISSFNGWYYNRDNLTNVSYTTTSGTHSEYLLAGNYTVLVNSSGYASETFNITFNDSSVSRNVSLWGYNSLYITFRDQGNYSIVDYDNLSIELISSSGTANQTTTNGTIYLTNLTSDSYTARYWGDTYNERFYYFTINPDSSESLTLYLINTTDEYEVNITIIDQTAREVEGAIVKALKYNFSSNNYYIQEIGVTNSDGRTSLTLSHNDEYYKFMIEYDSILVKTTNPAYIQSNDITIQVIIGSDVGQEFWEFGTILYNLTFNNETNNFRYSYTDNNNLANNFCLSVFTNSSTGEKDYNFSCSSSSSATILVTVEPVNGTTYNAYAFYGTNLLDTASHTYPDFFIGTPGLFLQILLLMAFLVVGLYKLEFMPIGLFTAVLVGRLVNLNSLGWGAITGLAVTMIIFSFLIKRGGK